ncbi:hypothetical protein Tco_1143609 [Tanacetum coccineum]
MSRRERNSRGRDEKLTEGDGRGSRERYSDKEVNREKRGESLSKDHERDGEGEGGRRGTEELGKGESVSEWGSGRRRWRTRVRDGDSERRLRLSTGGGAGEERERERGEERCWSVTSFRRGSEREEGEGKDGSARLEKKEREEERRVACEQADVQRERVDRRRRGSWRGEVRWIYLGEKERARQSRVEERWVMSFVRGESQRVEEYDIERCGFGIGVRGEMEVVRRERERERWRRRERERRGGMRSGEMMEGGLRGEREHERRGGEGEERRSGEEKDEREEETDATRGDRERGERRGRRETEKIDLRETRMREERKDEKKGGDVKRMRCLRDWGWCERRCSDD